MLRKKLFRKIKFSQIIFCGSHVRCKCAEEEDCERKADVNETKIHALYYSGNFDGIIRVSAVNH